MYKDQVLYTTSDRKLKLGEERRNEAGTKSGVQGWHNKERQDIKGREGVTIYDKRLEANWKQT